MTVTITRTQRRFVLPESELPTHYVNIAADLPVPQPPPLHPGTREPIGPEMLAPLFPMELIKQEVSADPLVEIPEEVREAYRIFRPTPLHRATATGAGQWGSALAFAGSLFGLETKVFMVRVSYEQKPYRRSFIESFGATVIPSPSNETNAGRAVLAEDPDSTGSLGVEPASCPSLTQGEYRYDFGDTAGTTPLLKMHTLGNDFRPAPIHAGGLRYHGMAPLISHLYELGFLEARAYAQNACFEAAVQFARTEGLIPAPESSHAIRAAIDEALDARDAREEKVILFNLSGHGFFDMAAYDDYLSGKLS